MAAEKIGRAKCPVCSSERARLSLSKAGLACLTCDHCNLQAFARSGNSDERLRALHVADKPATEPAPQPAAPPAPRKLEAPAPAPAAFGWGILPGALA